MKSPADFHAIRKKNCGEFIALCDLAIENTARNSSEQVARVSVRNFPHDIVEDVLDAYRVLGWKVERIADNRDGDFVEFRP